MDIFKETDLTRLLNASDKHCISIYMPAHRTGREQQQDPIRFGNLVAEAQERLLEYGVRRIEVQKLIRPAETLLDDDNFWQHQGDGLAVFLSNDLFQSYRLPYRFEELMVIGENFHIKPLLPLLDESGQFYILALSLNEVRLFLGTKNTMNEVELPSDMPKSMEEALFMDDPEKHLDFHTGTRNPRPGTPGERPAVYHGQGVQADEKDKTDILRYFQYVDDGLKQAIQDNTIPMVAACVDYLLPIYQEANNYPGLLSDGLIGNPEELRSDELHQRAWDLVKPIFGEKQRLAMKQFKQLHGKQSDLASDDLKAIISAAKFGMVDTLFPSLGVQHWGKYDASKNQVILDEEPNGENEDLLNYAARQTLLNSGRVFALHPDELPIKSDLAAILRYSNK